MALLTDSEIDAMGFASVGENVRISNRASFYGTERISIGANSRVDDFVLMSAGAGGIEIGHHVHVAVFSSLVGGERIVLHNYANISSRVCVYSSTDDFSGEWMTSPTVPTHLTNVTHAPVSIGRHSVIGTGCVVLPGTTIGDFVSVGALSLVKSDCTSHWIYAGVPARQIKERSRRILEIAPDENGAA